mmetsp:Transcript_3353/g.8909  ORF Transcript_3353/g.8909 Transcript_3353/m.8909 type:complete len:101 (+) Transcript_3353:924-1226(+)
MHSTSLLRTSASVILSCLPYKYERQQRQQMAKRDHAIEGFPTKSNPVRAIHAPSMHRTTSHPAVEYTHNISLREGGNAFRRSTSMTHVCLPKSIKHTRVE